MNIIFGVISFAEPPEHRKKVIKKFISLLGKNRATVQEESSSLYHMVRINNSNVKESSRSFNQIKNEAGSFFILKTDEFGFEPWYYFFEQNTLYFSSHQRHLISFLNNPIFNKDILCELFTLGFVAPPDTLIKNLYSLPTTKYLYFDGGIKLLARNAPEEFSGKILNEYQIREHLLTALCPIKDKENIGILCSGGLDSTLLASLLHQDFKKPIDLFTVLSQNDEDAFLKLEKIKKHLGTNNHYFQLKEKDFFRGVYNSVFYGEGEMVGALSLNASVEYLFSEYLSKQSMDILLTGDDNWIVPKNIHSQFPGYYALKYGVLHGKLLNEMLRENRGSYLRYCHKYRHLMAQNIELNSLIDHRREVHAVLIGKINGKIRMGQTRSPEYYFPLLNASYDHYISELNLNQPDFEYREVLKDLIVQSGALDKGEMNQTKQWMPSFFNENYSENIVKVVMEKIIHESSFVSFFFGKSTVMSIIEKSEPFAKIKFIMMLLYLTVFHEIFLSGDNDSFDMERFDDQ